MGRSTPKPPALKLHLALNAAALAGAAVLLALVARAGGFSTLRLILITATSLLAIAAAGTALHLHRRPSIERRIARTVAAQRRRLAYVLAVAFLGFWCLTWTPPQYTRDAYYHFIGLYPLLLAGLFASGTALVLLAAPIGSFASWFSRYLRERRTALYIALLMLAASALVVLLTAQLHILNGAEPYWYGAGVPLLAGQVLLAILVSVLVLRMETWQESRRLSGDVILFVLIWAAAALLWAARPVPPSYWITDSRPPNFESYPFSDLVTYDVASQFALIGQGIYNHMFFDRALYMSFLVYLHIIGGQDYQHLMAIQAAVFAVFPALLYLIGKRLHSRTAGLVLAALVTLRGLTGLDASAWIDTATFKHMLTDFPTAIAVAAFVCLMLGWLESRAKRNSSLIWAGGILGLGSLLRPHVLLLMAGAALLAVWVYRPYWRRGLGAAALASLAFLMGVLPWLTLGPSSGSLVTLYGDRVRDVIAQRYPRSAPTALPAIRSSPAAPAPQGSVATAVPPPPEAVMASPSPAPSAPVISPPPDPGPPFVVDHFLHNLVTSAMIFPSSPQLLTMRGVVKEGEEFWRPRWTGGMNPVSALMLVINLGAVAFGVGISVQRHRLRGLLPLVVMLLYLLANSAARTSGGRYIVPVDWILVGYFSVAVAEVAHSTRSFLAGQPVASLAAPTERPPSRINTPSRAAYPARAPRGGKILSASNPIIILLLVLLLGSLVPLAGVLYPRRYGAIDNAALISKLQLLAPQVGTDEALQAFMLDPDAVIAQGRLLYPLYYREGEGEPTRHAPYAPMAFPRTVFVLIGPRGILHVVLPGGRTGPLPNASDAIVLGCQPRRPPYTLIQALAVALPDQRLGLVRSPGAPLHCPLPDPICDGNGNCG